MNLHSSLRYPFLKYIIEELSGTFFENDFTSLNRLVILYHNKYSFTVKPNDIHGFLDSHERGLFESEWSHWWLSGTRRNRINLVKYRTAFALRYNRETFEGLLARKDYTSPEAIHEALMRMLKWLRTLSSESFTDPNIDLQEWHRELAMLIQQTSKSSGVEKTSLRMSVSSHFQEQFVGARADEKSDKFKRFKEILLEHQWIIPTGDSGVYRYCKQAKGGRLYIAALYYVLMEKGYIKMTIDAPQIAASINSWLVHDFEQSSFTKAFQAEELSQFDGRERNPRTKYLTEVRLLLRDL